jgi:hypothetical protein
LCKQTLSSCCCFFLQKCHDLHFFSLLTCLYIYIYIYNDPFLFKV